eukprot:gi/632983579/ref/XP_007908717.1/ PREDICTED: SPRY domain-containing protein 4 [Callorhinchus milii]
MAAVRLLRVTGASAAIRPSAPTPGPPGTAPATATARCVCVDIHFKLDERTAHSCLDLFKGNTGVIHRLLGVELSRLPSNAERFRDWAVVLADSPLSSGRHYWEVTVKRSQEFRIGVAEVNMSREECIGANETSWVYAYMQRKWYSMASNEVVPVSLFGKPQRVGLLLDCQGRKLSLVDVEKGSVVDTMLIEMRSPVTPAFALWDGQLVTHPGLETPEGV